MDHSGLGECVGAFRGASHGSAALPGSHCVDLLKNMPLGHDKAKLHQIGQDQSIIHDAEVQVSVGAHLSCTAHVPCAELVR